MHILSVTKKGMDNYYAYRDIKAMIARRLMTMDGWKVYGYKEDKSDFMTDYYDPANWSGVAEKNGYVLCINVYGKADPYEEVVTTVKNDDLNSNILDKINKLKGMTVDRGASPGEQETAEEAIRKLEIKMSDNASGKKKVIHVIPGHMENPPRMNWHLEKDGVYILKGNGILKYSRIERYYDCTHICEDMKKFRTLSRAEYRKELIESYINNNTYRRDRVDDVADEHIAQLEKDLETINSYEEFIRKIDSACGAQIGKKMYTYEKEKIVKYKKEKKAYVVDNGTIKDDQCFILNTDFNYRRSKGSVYRVHERKTNAGSMFYAYRLNPKLTKECTGMSNPANCWYLTNDFIKWIDKKYISWCEIRDVKTAYEEEKLVKKYVSSKEKKRQEDLETTQKDFAQTLTYILSEDTDTRSGEKVFLVKVMETLNHDDYIKLNAFMKKIGGYYSKFKHAFLFSKDPSAALRL